LLFKTENKWTPTQRARAEVLFHLYPDLEKAYELTMKLRNIYRTVKEHDINNHMITHATTNLSASELESYYGNCVRSHIREMFILIAFDSSAKDKRKMTKKRIATIVLNIFKILQNSKLYLTDDFFVKMSRFLRNKRDKHITFAQNNIT